MQKTNKGVIQKYNDLSVDQAAAKKVINNNTITCLLGKAGTGKTRLATSYALERLALERKKGGVNKIIITRPTVGRKEDDIGFLPGSAEEKMNFWMMPIIDILEDLEGVEATKTLMKDKVVQIVPLMYIKGRTFPNSIVIIDEASDLSVDGAEMVFTRLGKGSKMIFCGDPKQSLLDVKKTGLDRLVELSSVVTGLDHYELTTNFRHKLIDELLKVY
jgi:phosphate starvation-inducible PhoH-like protein